ncbi:SusC/RagA family TonB-linked outer membrane protein [Chitinophaga alhagiae]|uniref:SusC/RagA family TonB-linked outer membrane protein n=2 Tax=Chitinophaga alhagiae TaxID=2203219 RepID=A0ABM6W9G1_9BACT|nr:SusC/RagA family TonB-linked outer membrane protein [Chitinophaga alhagiae]
MVFNLRQKISRAALCRSGKVHKLFYWRCKPAWIMRVSFFLLLTLAMHASGRALSQKITINVKDVPLEKVFLSIEQQSGYLFWYDEKLLKPARKVSLSVKDASLDQTLQLCLKNQDISYKIIRNTIVLSRNVQETNPAGNTPAADSLIRGTVKVRVKGMLQPAPGVSVSEEGASGGTLTDEQGNFAIRIKNGATLQFSMIGFKPRKVMPGQGPLQVVLEEDVSELDAVVVTGYQVQAKRAVTGSIAKVKGEDIENIPLQSFDKAIQGKAAGVLVQTATGVPGGAVKISIRGEGSITAGTEPLYIVDGVQFNSSSLTSRTSNNPLAYINPNDIESIEILKDAAAASVYGAQAANGVVLITTKTGKSGKTNVNLNYYQGISMPMAKVDVLNTQQALAMRQEALKNRYPDRSDAAIRSEVLQEYGLEPGLSDEDIVALPTYDWQNATFRVGQVQNIELSASGGNEKTTFYVSGAFNNHDGNVIGIDFKKGTAKVRIGHQASKRLSFDLGINMSLITQNGNTGSQGNTSGYASPQYSAVFMPPTVPIYKADGSFNSYPGMPGTGFNPVQAAVVDDNRIRHRALVGNFSATYKILDNLSFRSFYGLDYRYIKTDYYRDHRTPNGAVWNGYLIIEDIENINFTTTQTLNYQRQFNNAHNLSVLMGAEYRSDVSEYASARGEGFATYQLRTMQSAAVAASSTGSWTGFRRLGFFTQANYDFRKKYMLSATLRYDGSSRFGTDNQMGLFPAISAGWDVARESFMEDHTWVDQLKLRIGYGETGNDQINNVSSRGFYQGGGVYNGKAGLRLMTMANTKLGWERNVTLNLGTDFSLLKGRIAGAVEVYRRASKDLLLNRPVPWLSGFDNIDDNVGEVVNKGLEIELNTVNVKSTHFSWNTSFNISFLHNEVTQLYDGLQSISNTIRVGHPLKTYFRPRYAGVNSANGRPMWYDINGNITYLPVAADNVSTEKGALSDYFGGLTNTFRYKGFELNTMFHFDMGRYLVNQMNAVWYNHHGNTVGSNTLLRLYENRWTTPGQVTSIPRLIHGGAETNSAAQHTASTRFLEDASFIRLREVTLAYRFQPALLKRIHLSSARIYFTAVNLHTWTEWTGYDPEIALTGTVENNTGIIPQTRSFTAGIQVGL